MMDENIVPVDLSRSYRMLNHGPSVLVSAADESRINVMAAAWVMPLDFDPAKLVLVLDKASFTRKLIEKTGTLAISIPLRKIADQVLAVGSMSGKDIDKFEKIGLTYFFGSQVKAPLVKDCGGWFECKLISEPANQQHYDLFIVEIVAAWSDKRIFSEGRWHFTCDEDRTIHYQAGGSFFMIGDSFECASN